MPLELVKFRKKINVKAFVKGGGVSGQAGAIKLGLSTFWVFSDDFTSHF